MFLLCERCAAALWPNDGGTVAAPAKTNLFHARAASFFVKECAESCGHSFETFRKWLRRANGLNSGRRNILDWLIRRAERQAPGRTLYEVISSCSSPPRRG